jgi:hypothetical protein
MTKIFITFGGGTQNYIDAGKRLVRQIKRTKLFDEQILYTDEYLKKDEYFWNKHGNFVENNPRGYGHWLWKPYLTKITMDKMNDGDILLYLDSGCEFDLKKKYVLEQFFEYVKDEPLIATETDLAECQWTKMDLFVHLNALDDCFTYSYQREGGMNLFLVCEKTRSFVNKWYETCCNYHLIDDSPSVNPNHPWFRDHRHDQSVYSILFKQYNFYYNNRSLNECILYNRNRTGISEIEDDFEIEDDK